VYVEAGGKQLTITKSMPLQKGFHTTSPVLRTIAEGEVFDVLEGPKEEHAEPIVRARVRAASSGEVGWVTVRQKALRTWAPRYRCIAGVHLEEKIGASSKAVRLLEPGEMLELLDGPKEDGAG